MHAWRPVNGKCKELSSYMQYSYSYMQCDSIKQDPIAGAYLRIYVAI